LKQGKRELEESAQILETLDNIVHKINEQVEYGKVINVLLEQGLKLIGCSEKAAALVYDVFTKRYHFVAAIGCDGSLLEHTVNESEIRSIQKEPAEELSEGIYLVEKDTGSQGKGVIINQMPSPSVIAMSIVLQGHLAGYLLFEYDSGDSTFETAGIQNLKRFRTHAISAFARATLLRQMQNITDEIIKTQNQLVMQEKLASLGQLTAGIAHEIKNPLNFVTNFAEGSIELADEMFELLQEAKHNQNAFDIDSVIEIARDMRQNAIDIRENGRRADSIVRSMMDHARGEQGVRQEIDLNSLLKENIELAYYGYRAKDPSFQADIQLQLDTTLPMIHAVGQDLARVFLNILNNAFYALQQRHREKVKDYFPVIKVTTTQDPGWARIRIHDNGSGIPDDIKGKIYNPFYTTKPTGEGNTGLGLSISYDIVVKGYNGKIECVSEYGSYTEFSILLPVQETLP
jgi:signal transduction histidine kinase